MLEERFAAVSYTHLDVYKRQPNMAPDTIVLTVYMGDSPKALDIPMNAIPSVEIVPHEVPIIIDVSEHIKKDIIKKNSASIALRPIQIKAGTVPLIIQLATSAPISRSMMMGTSMPLIAVVTDSCMKMCIRDSGKTTVGRIIAQRLNRELIDTDLLIEKDQNMTISQIFDQFGENYFRDVETRIIKEAAGKTGTCLLYTSCSLFFRSRTHSKIRF